MSEKEREEQREREGERDNIVRYIEEKKYSSKEKGAFEFPVEIIRATHCTETSWVDQSPSLCFCDSYSVLITHCPLSLSLFSFSLFISVSPHSLSLSMQPATFLPILGGWALNTYMLSP